MEKKNTGLIVLVMILSIAVLGLGGFVIYDKILNSESKNNSNEINKEENNNDVVEYTESFISSDYIEPLLYSLSVGSEKIDENNIIETLYFMIWGINTPNDYFEVFPVNNFNLKPFMINSSESEEEIKKYYNYKVGYISQKNLNELTTKLFNCEFDKIKSKFIEKVKKDVRLDVFGEYNSGYIFAFAGGGGPGFNYKFVNNNFINDSKIYKYDIYCSLFNEDKAEFDDKKIGEVKVTSKYNKELQSYIFTEYNYSLDESIDINNCYAP